MDVGQERMTPSAVLAIRFLAAAVWLTFGLVFKVFGAAPRHRDIVAAILGSEIAGPATVGIGLLETALGLWVLSGRRPRLCASVQTAAIVAMNAIELRSARDLLLSPVGMVAANAAFLALVWYAAARAG